MTFTIQITPRALKQIAKLDKPTRLRIEHFLKSTLDRENPRANGRALIGEPFWRYRVGDYRVLALIDDDVLIVLVVSAEHRRSAYRNV